LPGKRRHERIPYTGPVRLSWEDERGQVLYTSGRCVNVSDGGLRIEVPEWVPVRTNVTLRADRINVSGTAVVKHVSRRGTRFLLGLAISQQLRSQGLSKLLDTSKVMAT
jgi:hypothetical protein